MIAFLLSVLVIVGLILAPRWTLTALLFYYGHIGLGIIALVCTVIITIIKAAIFISDHS